ncbi:DNA primase family protein [Mesobacillus foraminis]|uniref:DNA primase family protein n=1 Tax=Mesobacillus foraminis TaxID=279826 RepID=UPI0013CEA111|nr:DNA primase family protein [Mesobacillus foraminis]
MEERDVSNILEAYFERNKNGKYSFLPGKLCLEYYDESPFFSDKWGTIYQYSEGIYKKIEQLEVKNVLQRKLGPLSKPSLVNEAFNHLQVMHVEDIVKYMEHEPHIFNFENCLYDLDSNITIPHTPEIKRLSKFRVKYNPDAACPRFDEFLNMVVPDEEDKELLYQVIGYSLVRTLKHQVAFLLTGSGKNGKSTYLDVIRGLLGEENCASISLHYLCDGKFASGHLFGKYANIDTEMEKKVIKSSSVFKKSVGGETLTAEIKGGRFFEYRPFATQFYSANQLPPTQDTSFGFYRRWIVLDFPNQIPVEKRIIDYHLALLESDEEKSGIVNRALRAYEKLRNNKGFIETKSTLRGKQKLLETSDTIRTFINDCCFIGPDQRIPKTLLYKEYKTWVKEFSIEYGAMVAVSNRDFYSRLKEEGYQEIKSSGIRYIQGISIED